jgi:sulfite dehydrogenase (cytochrome) subunit B
VSGRISLGLATVVLALAFPLVAAGAERQITLPPDDPYAALPDGPGAQETRNACGVCHSTDYIRMQPRGDAKQWQAVVTKMIKVFGAPLRDEDAKVIVDYLSRAYGPAQ